MAVREGEATDVDAYDVIIERRAGCASCDQSRKRATCARTTWYLAIALEKEEIGISRGVRPLEFNCRCASRTRLVGAGSAVAARGGDGAVVKAAGAKGNGCTCCVQVVRRAESRREIREKVVLNVTKGHVRALPQAPCPALPASPRTACRGLCVATWLYLRPRAAQRSRPSAALTVPNGLGIDIDHAEGDWYVSVLSLDGGDAEYRLALS